MRVIYICEQPRFSKKRQEEILGDMSKDKVYVEGRGAETLDQALKSLRGDATLICAKGLRPLGNNPSQVTEKLKVVKKRGKAIEDAETGDRSDRDGALMFGSYLSQIKGEKSIGNRAAEIGSEGGKALAKKRAAARMPKSRAEKIWKDKKIRTNAEAVARMTNWTVETANKHFGKSGRPVGRRKSK